MTNRRTFLAASLLVGGVAIAPATAAYATSQGRLTLPPPTGEYPVGTVDLHLIDRSRPNPWPAGPPYRELMVSLWYPAARTTHFPRTPHMLPGAAAHFGSAAGAGSTLYGIPAGAIDFAATRTSGHRGAPIARHRRPFPVVLYSPGAGDPRTWETTVVQDLASRGYVVVTIDHTYDASEVQFPDGRVVEGLLNQLFEEAQQPEDFQRLASTIFDARLADTRFVLDRLAALNRGSSAFSGALDLSRTGMFGVSAGGLTALRAMGEDSRIRAAIDIGGSIESPLIPDVLALWPVARHGLAQPFMFMGYPGTDHHQTPSWQLLWQNSTGWRVDLQLKGASGEDSYKDAVPLIPQIARQLGLPDSFVTRIIGSIDPARAVDTERKLVAAFFDKWLRGRDGHELDGPSPRFPDVTFVS
ncbi:alpha/beta hydrolase family protein [Paractinoplanes lichenicola]|uniref:Lipase n=1 Tax=Paractinoplanes lichenicola TaxID=2802976 RepID=A0ABS1VJF2_9ACTN|nr:lipase [Actinoplanes lichenicola]MBL7253872.1 lipase [Actinoplanes lichenicola]